MPSPPSATAPPPISPDNKTKGMLAFHVGLPIVLAVLAGILNFVAVRNRITPTTAYVLTRGMHPGERLTPDDLSEVQVAGTLGKELLLSPDDLRFAVDLNERLTLADSLERFPRFASRIMERGELVTKQSLGGRETIQPGANEELVQVPRSAFRGGADELQPGQFVYLLTSDRSSLGDPVQAQELGPFRVALVEVSETTRSRNKHNGTVPLIYQLDRNGNPPDYAIKLREAALMRNQNSLAILEKGRRFADPSSLASSRVVR